MERKKTGGYMLTKDQMIDEIYQDLSVAQIMEREFNEYVAMMSHISKYERTVVQLNKEYKRLLTIFEEISDERII